jgi:hypothetical protein
VRSARDARGSAVPKSDEERPVRPPPSTDNNDMKTTTIFPIETPAEDVPFVDLPTSDPRSSELDLHLVQPGRREQADPQQQRRAFQARCAALAHLLSQTKRFEDRLELYRYREFTRHELTTAAALYPELMPRLNDEWEWIALSLADYEHD